MSNYERILVAIDFSDISQQAVRRAIELAGFYQAALVFMHVIEHFPEHLPHYQMSREDMDPEEFLISRAREDLQELCVKLGQEDAEHVVRLTKHSAKAEIIKYVRKNGIGLIVLGSKGRGRIGEWLAGSTATGIVRSATCDVFIVRGSDKQ